MTSVAAHDFDRDSALEPGARGVRRGRVDPSWFVVDAPNGGFMAALAARALEAETARPARSLTLHFLRPAAEGPVDVECRIGRTGATSTFTTLRMSQRGETIVLGLGMAAEWRDGEPAWADEPMPDVPPLAEAPLFATDRPPAPPYWAKYDMRWAVGDFSRRQDPARVGAWLRAAGGRALDAPLLAAMSDALMPPAFVRLGFRAVVPTVDLTVHFRAPAPAGATWALGVFESRVAAGGFVEEDGRLFSEDGVLLAQTRQLSLLRGRAR